MPIGLGIGIGISIGGGSGGGVSPPRIQLSGLSIAETGGTVGTLSVANSEATWTFAITADPDSKFTIENDDELVAADLDYETATSHLVTIEATPDVGDAISRTFTITVTNVLEVTLNALSLDADELTENSPEDTVVGAIVGASSGSTVTLHADAGGRFKKSSNNIVAGATPSDYEVATSYEITLRETHPDASNSPRDTVIEVTILDDPDDTDTVPDAFEAGDWSIAAGDEEADVTISSLPDDGGDTITDVEYRLDGGSWVSSVGTTSFTITGLTNDQEYDVELRAVNSVGAGAASDVKQVTPEDAGGAWDPLTPTSQAIIWLDPSDASTMWKERTGSPPTTPAVVDDVVGTILNKGTAGGYWRATSDAQRPILRQSGALYYLDFDGTDDGLYSASSVTVGNDGTLAIAAQFDALPNFFCGIGIVSTSGNIFTGPNAFHIGGGATGSNISVWVDGAARVPIASSTGTDYVFVAKKSGANLSLARNNGTPVTATITNAAIGAAICNVMRTSAGSQANGRMYQGVMAAADWTSGDLSSLWTFMGNKAGLSL
jgi:hypothetical protein